MRVIYYAAKSEHTYDVSVSCCNCSNRHIARLPKGVALPEHAACPFCGVGDSLDFGSSYWATIWLDKDPESKNICLDCGKPIGPEQTRCGTCWDRNFQNVLSAPTVPDPLYDQPPKKKKHQPPKETS